MVHDWRIVMGRTSFVETKTCGNWMEIRKGVRDSFGLPKGLEGEIVGKVDNPFHNAKPTNFAAREGLDERLVDALELNNGGINVEVANFINKTYVEEQDNDVLDPVYDEYLKESKEVDVYSWGRESSVVHIVTFTTSVRYLLDISKDTRSDDESRVKITDMISTVKYDFAMIKFNVELKKKQVHRKALNLVCHGFAWQHLFIWSS